MKKRSLFVATAMLLVAVLVATGATYAWFKAEKEATATVNLGVADAASLELSTDSLLVNDVWQTAIDAEDLGFTDANSVWTDLSTTNDLIVDGDFFMETYDANGVQVEGAYAEATCLSATVYFRSLTDEDVIISESSLKALLKGTQDAPTNYVVNDAICSTLRVGVVQDDSVQILKGQGATQNSGISTTTGTPAEQTANDNFVITLAKANQEDEYFQGNAKFFFWLEGTEEKCVDTVVNDIAKCQFNATFTQTANND